MNNTDDQVEKMRVGLQAIHKLVDMRDKGLSLQHRRLVILQTLKITPERISSYDPDAVARFLESNPQFRCPH